MTGRHSGSGPSPTQGDLGRAIHKHSRVSGGCEELLRPLEHGQRVEEISEVRAFELLNNAQDIWNSLQKARLQSLMQDQGSKLTGSKTILAVQAAISGGNFIYREEEGEWS